MFIVYLMMMSFLYRLPKFKEWLAVIPFFFCLFYKTFKADFGNDIKSFLLYVPIYN
jgi:hypothetical protein